MISFGFLVSERVQLNRVVHIQAPLLSLTINPNCAASANPSRS